MRVLAFGTYDAQSHPRVGVLLQGLRDAGHDVVELNRPLGIDTAGRVAMMQQPWRLPVLAWRLLVCWSALTVGALRERRRGRRDAVLVGYLGHLDVRLARRLFPDDSIVLDHLASAAGTAEDRVLAGSGGVKARLMLAIDSGALRAADRIVVDTPQHLRRLPEEARPRAVVCPVGATHEWFAAGGAPGVGGGKRLRVVFVGLFTPLHGTTVIADAVAQLADDDRIEFSMVGQGQDHAEARRRASVNPRVSWIDWVTSEALPGFVACHEVSLGIFGTTVKALDVVPTKVYQGAAAGCVVVTSDTAPQRAALADAAVLIPPGDAAMLAAALRELAADPELVHRLRRAARERAQECFTARATVEPLLERLRDA